MRLQKLGVINQASTQITSSSLEENDDASLLLELQEPPLVLIYSEGDTETLVVEQPQPETDKDDISNTIPSTSHDDIANFFQDYYVNDKDEFVPLNNLLEKITKVLEEEGVVMHWQIHLLHQIH